LSKHFVISDFQAKFVHNLQAYL